MKLEPEKEDDLIEINGNDKEKKNTSRYHVISWLD